MIKPIVTSRFSEEINIYRYRDLYQSINIIYNYKHKKRKQVFFNL